MKNFKVIVLLTLVVSFLASDFAQAQYRRTRPSTTPAASPTGDGWSAWKSVDSKARAIHNKECVASGDQYHKVLKYRVNGNHYQFQVQQGLFENGPRPVRYDKTTEDFYVNSGSNTAVQPVVPVQPTGNGWSAWKSVDSKAWGVFNKHFMWAGGPKPRPVKYRISDTRRNYEFRLPASEGGGIFSVSFESDGSVTTQGN